MIVIAILSQFLAQFIEPKLRIPIFSIAAFALYVASCGVIVGILLYFTGVLILPNIGPAFHLLKNVRAGYIVTYQNTMVNRRSL